MLLMEIPRLPPDGLDLDEALDPEGVHLAGDDELSLKARRLKREIAKATEKAPEAQAAS